MRIRREAATSKDLLLTIITDKQKLTNRMKLELHITPN